MGGKRARRLPSPRDSDSCHGVTCWPSKPSESNPMTMLLFFNSRCLLRARAAHENDHVTWARLQAKETALGLNRWEMARIAQPLDSHLPPNRRAASPARPPRRPGCREWGGHRAAARVRPGLGPSPADAPACRRMRRPHYPCLCSEGE